MFKFDSDTSRVTTVFVIAIAIVLICGMVYDSTNIKRFVKNGYTRQTIAGSCAVQWVKP